MNLQPTCAHILGSERIGTENTNNRERVNTSAATPGTSETPMPDTIGNLLDEYLTGLRRKGRKAATRAEAEQALTQASRLLDRAGRKNIVHKNQASRTKSRLTKMVAEKQ